MASRLPWFQLYQDDWLADPALSGVSLLAEGAWIRIVCAMRRADSGTLSGSLAWWARFLKQASADETIAILDELASASVGDIVIAPDKKSASVTSRRVTRDLEKEDGERELWREQKAAQRSRRPRGNAVSASCPPDVRPVSADCPVDVRSENQNQNQNQKEEKKNSLSAGLRQPTDRASSELVAALESKHPPGGEQQPHVAAAREEESTPASRVFAHWIAAGKEHGHPHVGAVLSEKRRNLIRARLRDGITEQQLCDAITGYHLSPWHRGDNDRHTAFLHLELLLRDVGKVEAGLGFFRDHGSGGGAPVGTAEAPTEFARLPNGERVQVFRREGRMVTADGRDVEELVYGRKSPCQAS